MNLSAIVLTKNEEKGIKDVVKNLSFTDEIIVLDDNSTDKTKVVAKNMGARVVSRSLNGDFAAQRNFALGKAKGKWVLFVDADERVGANLKDEIVQAVNNPLLKNTAYSIRRQDVLWGRKMKGGEFGKTRLIRLAKKDAGQWTRRVHERWEVKGPVGSLKYPLMHSPHKNLSEFISSANKDSSLHAAANKEEGKSANLFRVIVWPKIKLVKNVFLQSGYKDEMPGFVAAVIMSFHSFLAWSKLLVKQKAK